MPDREMLRMASMLPRSIPRKYRISVRGLQVVLLAAGALALEGTLGAVPGLSSTAVAADPAVESRTVLVKVNGRAITEGDLEFLYLVRRVRDEVRSSVRDRYIEQLIDRSLLEQFLRERQVEVSDKLVDERVSQLEGLVEREGLDFDEVIARVGFSRETFRQEVVLPLAWRRHSALAITDAAIESWWVEHRSEFDGTERRAAQIVKRVPKDADDATIVALTAELSKVRDQIVAGATTFSAAAEQHSDSPTAKQGGDLGQFAWRGRMPSEIADAAFMLKPGEVSEPFQTRFGMHLLIVTEVIPGDLSLEDARPEIFKTLSQNLQDDLLVQLRKAATIERSGQAASAAAGATR